MIFSRRAVQTGFHMGTIALLHMSVETETWEPAVILLYCTMVEKPSIPGGMWNMSHTFSLASLAWARLDWSQVKVRSAAVESTREHVSAKLAAWYLLEKKTEFTERMRTPRNARGLTV